MSTLPSTLVRSTLCALAAAATLGGLATPAAAGSMVVGSPAAPLAIGDIFSVQVRGENFAEFIVGGGFNLGFDPAVLQLEGPAVIAPIWEFVPNGGTMNNAVGTLTDASFNTFSNPRTGNFAVATINLRAVGAGGSALALGPSALWVFSDIDGNLVTPDFISGQVQVVPEPASIALMLGGLALLLPVLRRRQN